MPIEIKLRVVMRQLGYSQGVVNEAVRTGKGDRALGDMTALFLARLAEQRHCAVSDLRLDHDPPLGARPKERRGLGKKTYYIPDANSPEHLNYRPHGPEFDESHLIKTNVRGEHGQHPDRVLIVKARRIERGPKPKRGPKIKSRGFASGPAAKRKWPKRPFARIAGKMPSVRSGRPGEKNL